jgi:hypothetical protein
VRVERIASGEVVAPSVRPERFAFGWVAAASARAERVVPGVTAAAAVGPGLVAPASFAAASAGLRPATSASSAAASTGLRPATSASSAAASTGLRPATSARSAASAGLIAQGTVAAAPEKPEPVAAAGSALAVRPGPVSPANSPASAAVTPAATGAARTGPRAQPASTTIAPAKAAVTRAINPAPRPPTLPLNRLIDSTRPACGTFGPLGVRCPNLWTTHPDVDNPARRWPPVGEGLVAGGRIFSAVRVSGLTSRARARSPRQWNTGRGESHGVRRSLRSFASGSGHRHGHQGERPPGRERQNRVARWGPQGLRRARHRRG